MKKIHWKWLGIFFLGVLALLFGKNTAAALLTNYLVSIFNNLAVYILVVFAVLSVILAVPLLYWIYVKLSPDKLEAFGLTKYHFRRDLLLAFAVATISAGLALFIVIPLAGETNETVINVRRTVNAGSFLNILLAGILIGGFLEELFFRGHMITSIRRINPDSQWLLVFAVVLSSLLFGYTHRHQGWLGLTFVGVHSVVYAILFIKTKSLASPMLAHALYDSLVAIGIKYFV